MWGGIAAGIGSFFGQKDANSSNEKIASRTNRFNRAEAERDRTWQETMSNSAYQRSMADMEKAGLNPMLAYQQGGASTPSGAQASGVTAKMENEMDGAVSSAMQGIRLKQEVKNMKADEKVKNQTAKTARAHEGKLKKETEAISKSMGKNSAIGKAGNIVTQGLETITNSAKSFSPNTPPLYKKFNENRQNAAEKNQKKLYKKSQAYKDARRKK